MICYGSLLTIQICISVSLAWFVTSYYKWLIHSTLNRQAHSIILICCCSFLILLTGEVWWPCWRNKRHDSCWQYNWQNKVSATRASWTLCTWLEYQHWFGALLLWYVSWHHGQRYLAAGIFWLWLIFLSLYLLDREIVHIFFFFSRKCLSARLKFHNNCRVCIFHETENFSAGKGLNLKVIL